MSRARTTSAVAIACLVAVSTLTLSGAARAAEPAANVCAPRPALHHFTCFALRENGSATSQARLGAAAQASTPAGYGPSDLQSAYALGAAPSGSGRRVFVVDAFDDPRAASDLAAYRSHYGLPACTVANHCFSKVDQRGSGQSLPRPNDGWAGETSLDLDMISAACPACSITLVEADDDTGNLFVAAREAVTLGARFVSISWGGPEGTYASSYDRTYLRSTGVFYSVATGDDGYGASYPSTSPLVVAVGGTSLRRSTSARGWAETAWSGGGSGCSAYEARPSWEGGVVTSCPGRAAADVSADADPATGVAVYDSYQSAGWNVYGGTSAAAPVVAAIAARADAATTKPGALPYAHSSHVNDVTSGSNGSCAAAVLCHAGTGWDGPTGLGTPQGVATFGGTNAPQRSTTCAGDAVSNSGFESGAASWTTRARVLRDRARAHTGSHFVTLDRHPGSTVLARRVTLPRSCHISLTYYLRVDTRGHTSQRRDLLAAEVDGRAVTTYSNLDASRHYQRHTLDLSPYAGQQVSLAWVASGKGRSVSRFDLDDVALTLSP